jgi:tetratricopeptide (TPR) repeat protein/predicted Ser/Thr protein kinase
VSDTVRSEQTVIAGSEAPEDRFASAWFDDGAPPPPLTEFLPQEGDAGYLATLERLVQIQIEQSWRRSSHQGSARPHSLEEYLERFPVLRTPEAIQRLARTEFVARSQFGDRPEAQSYVARFPGYITPESAAELLNAARTAAPISAPSFTVADLGMLGGYKLLEQIGEGGMGVVYRAVQPGADRVVALKVIRTTMTSAGEAFRQKAESRFRNEIHAASKLEHENIVPVYDAGSVGDLMYFAMRFVDGKSLSELVKHGPIENQQAAKYIAGAARGVSEAHRRGILHRDLKPHNVMVEARTGRPMVADFGLAKVLDTDDHLTRTGEAIGTPSYMPPEQINDAGKVDQRGDVYSLGATLYHLLTGRPPFQAANTLGTMRQVLCDEPVPPKRLNSAVDADLETISLKCLQKEPARRYQTAEEFIADLERYLRGDPIRARPIGRLERLNRWRRRHPLEAGLSAAAIALAGAALAATTIGYQSTKAALGEAEENLAVAKSAIDELYTEVSEIDLENQPGLQPLKQKLLTKALDYYRRLLDRQGNNPTLTAELADSHFRVGAITEEVKSVDDALPHYRKAAVIQRELLKQSSGDRVLTEKLGDSLNSIGRVNQKLQKSDAAQLAYDESRILRDMLVTLAPGDREYRRKLANVTMNSGLLKVHRKSFEAAADEYVTAQQIRQSLLDLEFDDTVARDFARGAFNQGILAQKRERTEEAIDHFRTAITWFQRLTKDHPEGLSNRLELAVASTLYGDLLAKQNKPTPALEAYAAARESLQQLVSENPKVVNYRERFAALVIGETELRNNIALQLLEQQPADEAKASAHLDIAEAILSAGAATLNAVIESDPERTGPRHDLAVICELQGDLKSTRRDRAGAEAAWRRGLDALAPLKDRFVGNPDCEEQWKVLQDRLKQLESSSN